jgi:leucyl aminopeptidase (aminopeptidase T)
LRWSTQNENQINRVANRNNSSGVKGITYDKNAKTKKYVAIIMKNRISYYLGSYSNLEDAKQARMKKANEIFGEFVNDCEKILPTIKLNSTVKLFKQIDKLLNEINHIKHL